jgi:hypothetical protein
LAWGETLDLDL